MTEATERFFESLPARAPDVLRGLVSGTLQIQLNNGDHTAHWRVRMAPGSIEVSRQPGPADAILYSTEDLFDRLVTGRAQLLAAVLRNESTLSGNVVLFLAFRRFFPDPPGTRDPREVAREQVGRPR
ncbi:SCP2 sterol-binding domain-containing protein [Micromonospora sp. WMMA1363]|uniref:SCP2 sterol-binding domain-containing protein n=1 Tax=Micromonospora sp. WMMA1363 TaxID=3053985 RepID=UPI00259D1130|nr:SCP2 sterol-binding domain-containing protein [Micromonospora sp. WMMA1363]MDM4721010.1 SCP2 sterol-binding domain-containing protein [Micromonospora sp. WMMA1363]